MTLIYKIQHPYNRMPLVTDQAAAFTGIGSGLAEVLTNTHKFEAKAPGLLHKLQVLFFCPRRCYPFKFKTSFQLRMPPSGFRPTGTKPTASLKKNVSAF